MTVVFLSSQVQGLREVGVHSMFSFVICIKDKETLALLLHFKKKVK